MQSDHIPNIRVKDLLISGVSRGTDLASIDNAAQIFDVGKHNISRLPIVLMILSTSDGSDV